MENRRVGLLIKRCVELTTKHGEQISQATIAKDGKLVWRSGKGTPLTTVQGCGLDLVENTFCKPAVNSVVHLSEIFLCVPRVFALEYQSGGAAAAPQAHISAANNPKLPKAFHQHGVKLVALTIVFYCSLVQKNRDTGIQSILTHVGLVPKFLLLACCLPKSNI